MNLIILKLTAVLGTSISLYVTNINYPGVYLVTIDTEFSLVTLLHLIHRKSPDRLHNNFCYEVKSLMSFNRRHRPRVCT